MAAKDQRKLERTSVPGVFRRHAESCKRNGRCACPYVVIWKQRGEQHKQYFPTFELARARKGGLASGKAPRRPQTAKTIEEYYNEWLPSYRGRTARGLEETTRDEYEISFRLHVLPFIGRTRMRDLAPPDLREGFEELERRGRSPRTIDHAKKALSVMLATAFEDGEIAANPRSEEH